MDKFKLVSDYKPTGDQPQAIDRLVKGFKEGNQFETLLGVTGSGKTFTMANVIEKLNKPTLIIAHNKTLAAQLYNEFKDFFPENAVEFFVSYYDYYQPEAYVPSNDTYIEKDASDTNCEMTVAMAAPWMPSLKTKMKIGSRAVLSVTVRMVANIAFCGWPDTRTMEFRPK